MSNNSRHVPKRHSSNPVEQRLIQLQREGDQIGLQAWQKVQAGNVESLEKIKVLSGLAKHALAHSVRLHTPAHLASRSLYDPNPNEPLGTKLSLPLDEMHYAAVFNGEITEVEPRVVEYYADTGKRMFGYRICATVIKTDESALDRPNMLIDDNGIYVPVGDLYLDPSKNDALHLEAIQ